MKHLYILLMLLSLNVLGQQKGLNYQAVILDPNAIEIPGQVISGQPLAKGKVWVRFTLLSQSGVDYEEVQETSTDEFGLINLTIGMGSSPLSLGSDALSGPAKFSQFDAMVWDKNLKRLRVSVNFSGTGKFTEVSNQLMTFSPYSLYAESVDYKNVRDTPTDLSFFKNDVGYLVNKDLDPIKKDVGVATQGVLENSAKIEANQTANKLRFALVDQSVKQVSDQLDQQTNDLQQVNTTLNDYGVRIQQNANQIQSNTLSIQGQIGNLQNQLYSTQSALSGITNNYESLANKSSAIDLGNSNPSNTLYPTQRAVKSYVDQAVSMVMSNGTPDATSLATGKVQLAGDLGGSASAPIVAKLQGITVSAANPTVGQVLKYNGTAWVPDVAVMNEVQTLTLSGSTLTISGTNSSVVLPTASDATASSNGMLRLAGDLGGTGSVASAPVISDNAINTSKLANGSVTDAKFSGVLSIVKGGTGATSLSGIIKGNGSSALSPALLNSDYSLVRFVSDEISVSIAGQTSFTLTQSPNANSVISFFINGVRISKNAVSISGNNLTYIPANNGAANLVLNDRVQIDYYY